MKQTKPAAVIPKPVNKEWGKVKSLKLVHAFEQLDAIEKATGDDKVKLLKEYGAKTPLSFLLSLNFRSDIQLDLPEGMPPLAPNELDAATHPDLAGSLSSTIHRLKNCMVGNNTVKQFKKEDIFVQILLACPLKDAEILCAAKDKELEELYPSIDAELVSSCFNGYVR